MHRIMSHNISLLVSTLPFEYKIATLGLSRREGEVSRIRGTRPQVGLRPEQRRLNIDGAFVATARLQGRRIALVDDVLTTGATAGAVAAALHSAGASSVDVWCVARAAHQ